MDETDKTDETDKVDKMDKMVKNHINKSGQNTIYNSLEMIYIQIFHKSSQVLFFSHTSDSYPKFYSFFREFEFQLAAAATMLRAIIPTFSSGVCSKITFFFEILREWHGNKDNTRVN